MLKALICFPWIISQELPKDKWFCCDDCNKIHVALQNSVLRGAETIPASLFNTIFKKHAEKGLFIEGAANDIQWRIMSGKSRYAEHLPLLSTATSIFRVSCLYTVLDSNLFSLKQWYFGTSIDKMWWICVPFFPYCWLSSFKDLWWKFF